MYRLFLVKDEANNEMEFKVYADRAPPNKDHIDYVKFDIDMKLSTQKALSTMIEAVNEFMGGNTINSVEVIETEEV